MTIRLEHISKRYGRNWILKGIDWDFEPGSSTAITGPNGSGKSTLLKIISGGLAPSTGNVIFERSGEEIYWSDASLDISYAAPYTDLIEGLTLAEHLDFHFRFRTPVDGMSADDILLNIDMESDRRKRVADFSSGMKQRLKLALTLFTESAVILLDEPTTNLDEHWAQWYSDLVQKRMGDSTLIIASNMEREYAFAKDVIRMSS